MAGILLGIIFFCIEVTAHGGIWSYEIDGVKYTG